MADEPEALSPPSCCGLLLFVATSDEEKALKRAANELEVRIEKGQASTKWLRATGLGDTAWSLGTIGSETVAAIGPFRKGGEVVMGAHGRLGSAAKAIHSRTATGAQGIIQLGMAFGVSRVEQSLADVLISAMLCPYDNRVVRSREKRPCEDSPGYVNDYSEMEVERPRVGLLDRFRREKNRREGKRHKVEFRTHIGAMLSGAPVSIVRLTETSC